MRSLLTLPCPWLPGVLPGLLGGSAVCWREPCPGPELESRPHHYLQSFHPRKHLHTLVMKRPAGTLTLSTQKSRPSPTISFCVLPSVSLSAPKYRCSPRGPQEPVPFGLREPWFPVLVSTNFLSCCTREDRPQSPFPGGKPTEGHCLRFTPSLPRDVHLSIC